MDLSLSVALKLRELGLRGVLRTREAAFCSWADYTSMIQEKLA